MFRRPNGPIPVLKELSVAHGTNTFLRQHRISACIAHSKEGGDALESHGTLARQAFRCCLSSSRWLLACFKQILDALSLKWQRVKAPQP